MRIELPPNPQPPIHEQWPGQYSLFSHYAFTVDVPSPVFIITTLKENGLANASLSAWGMAGGSGVEPKFFLQIHNYTDTRRLIEKNGEFVINYPAMALRLEAMNTAKRYDGETDEILASGLTPEPSKLVKPPRIRECFACLECKLEWMRDIETDTKVGTIVQAAIVHAAIDDSVTHDAARETLARRQWIFDVQEATNPANGAFSHGLFASLDVDKAIDL